MYTKTKTTSCALFIVSSTWICQRRTETRIYCMFAYSFKYCWKKCKLNRSILSKLSEFVYFHYNKWIKKKKSEAGWISKANEDHRFGWKFSMMEKFIIYPTKNANKRIRMLIVESRKIRNIMGLATTHMMNGPMDYAVSMDGHTCMWMGNTEREKVYLQPVAQSQ